MRNIITRKYNGDTETFTAPAGCTEVTVKAYRKPLGKVASNGNHNLAIVQFIEGSNNEGNIYAAGRNANGEVGDNSVVAKSAPTLSTGNNFAGVFSRGQNGATGAPVFALSRGGRLYSWGAALSGALGDNSIASKSVPTLVAQFSGTALDQWRLVQGGARNGIGINYQGGVYTWGSNSTGQLGDNTNIDKSTPTLIGAPSEGVIWVSMGSGTSGHGAYIRSDGTLFIWGDNGQGQLGQGDVIGVSTPTVVPSNNIWKKVYCGVGFTIAMDKDGLVYGFGLNDQGQLGQNDLVSRSTPTLITLANKAVDIAVGGRNVYVLTDQAEVYSFGSNAKGELGVGNAVARSTPTLMNSVAGSGGWTFIEAGVQSFIGIANGLVYACGDNNNGQLGDSTVVSKSTPTLFPTGGFTTTRTDELIGEVKIPVTPGESYPVYILQRNMMFAGRGIASNAFLGYLTVEYDG